jgi:micrococcal nuclease
LRYDENTYRCRLIRVVDGDTVQLDVDLGLRVRRTLTLRLEGIDAPETRGDEAAQGAAATEALVALLDGEDLIVRFTQEKSFDRWIGTLYLSRPDGPVSVGKEMVRRGAAARVL